MRHLKILAAICVVLAISGCYLPVRYDAEFDINRAGYYEFFFDGYIAKAQLYDGLRKGEITPTEEREQVEIIRTDFTRDPATTAFEYFRQGHFRVGYERAGDLLRVPTFVFFRRNEQFLSLSYSSETRQISMLGKSLSNDIKERIRNMGLDSSGELRVFTDAQVISHNANTVRPWPDKGPGYNLYTWRLGNIYAPTPSLNIQLR